MKKRLQAKSFALLLTALFLTISSNGFAQIIGWDTTGLSGFGQTPFAPAAIDTHLTSSGLIRGSGIGTSGSAAGSCWGGAGGWSTAQNDTNSFYFTFQPTAGYKVSLSAIATATRRSNAGPTGCSVWYSVGGSPFVKITDWVTTSTSGTTGTPNSTPLSSIPALQNIGEGTIVKFRLIPESTSGTGNYYITGGTNALRVEGMVEAAVSPLITPSVTALLPFGDVVVGTNSASQSFTVSTEGLTTELSVIAPVGYEISTDNANWFTGTDISTTGGILDNTPIWVRFAPTAVGPSAGSIQLLSEGAEAKTVEVSGTGVPASGLYVTPTVINNLSYPELQGPSAAFQLINLHGIGLSPASGNITLVPAIGDASNYELSGDGILWSTSLELPYTAADINIDNPEIYIRLKAGLSAGPVAMETINATGGTLNTSFTVEGLVNPASTIASVESTFGPFCSEAENTFNIAFTTNGPFSGTTFYAQLSNPDGTFPDTATNIIGSSETSPITATLPSDTPIGTKYRTRIFNQMPLTFSDGDNGNDIVVLQRPTSMITGDQEVCFGNVSNAILVALTGTPPWTITYTDGATPVTVNNILESPYLLNPFSLTTKTYSIISVNDANCSATEEGIAGSATVTVLLPSNGGNITGSATVCSGSSGTLTLENYTGDIVQWQSSSAIDFSANVTDISNTTDSLQYSNLTATTYFRASVSNGSCPSENATVAVIVVNTVTAPSAPPQHFCNGSNVGELFPSGANIQWYADPINETPLPLTDLLETGNYYVSQTIGDCESARTNVVITVDVVPAPEGENSQEFTEGETLDDLEVSGSNLTWYPTLEDAVSQTGALEETLPLNDAVTYYVTQTINGCTSIPLAVTVSAVLGIATFEGKTFDYYPNPVSETLYVVDASIIETISVFDMLGRELIHNAVHSEKTQIDVSSLLSGTYLVNVKTNGSNESFKVIKK